VAAQLVAVDPDAAVPDRAQSFLPAIMLMMTSFTRIIIVLSLLRQALGTQSSPPNQVLVGLALFLTFFIMAPVAEKIYTDAYLPMSENRIGFERGARARRSAAEDIHAQADARAPTSSFSCAHRQRAKVDKFGRPADAHPHARLRHLGAENRLPDRLHRLHPVHHHRHGGGQRC
jgi:flagellar biosynthesis protein FliP